MQAASIYAFGNVSIAAMFGSVLKR